MEYKIKKGDNLTKLSKRFGYSIAEIAAMNGIEDLDKIYEGDIINIPSKSKPKQKIDWSNSPDVRMYGGEAESVMPEMYLAGIGIPNATAGVLQKLAAMSPKALNSGRVGAPAGFSNIVPVGSNSAFNHSLAQAMKSTPVPASIAANQRRIPKWLRDGRTEMMMKQNPIRGMSQMADEMKNVGPKFSKSSMFDDAAELEDLLFNLRFGK